MDVSDGNVVRTLLPGDEPTDVVFAEGAGRAFVAVSQEDRLASYNLGDLTLPPASIALDHSDPRSLALSPDGSTVYVCALDSQNETTAVPFQTVQANGGDLAETALAGGLPGARWFPTRWWTTTSSR